MAAQYPDALIRELTAADFSWTPETVYIGGGTPSALDAETLARIVTTVPGRDWAEATIECAPGSFTRDDARAWRETGLNRVSLGAQSFARNELARTGRKHTAEVIANDVAMLRGAGIGNVNIDLIAGLPSQTEESWSQSLDWIARLDPPHVSVYMLEVDEDSRLGKELLTGGVRYGATEVPDDERIADLYEIAVERLAQLGIERYEISNFSRSGYESRHNLKYWQNDPYLGFGTDAHSFDGERRWQNTDSTADYVRLSPNATVATTQANRREEKFLTGLRLTRGVELDERDWELHGPAIRRFASGGVLEIDGARLRLTPRGVMVANEVLQEFLVSA